MYYRSISRRRYALTCGAGRRSQQTLVQFAMLQMKILCYSYPRPTSSSPSVRRLPRYLSPRSIPIGRVRKRIADNTWHVISYWLQPEVAIRSEATCGGTIMINAIAKLHPRVCISNVKFIIFTLLHILFRSNLSFQSCIYLI